MEFSLRTRRYIVGFFALVFFITAPIVIIYTSGYRFNLKHFSFTKTGNIFIESPDLSGAQIKINDEVYEEELNKKIFINDVLPGTYTVEVTKEDRYPWKKEISVQEGVTTFIKDVILFRSSEPILNLEQNVARITADNKGNNLIITVDAGAGFEYYLFTTDTNESRLMYRSTNETPYVVSWSSGDEYVLFSSALDSVIIEIKNQTLTTLPSEVSNYQWTIGRETLIAYNEQSVFEYVPSKKELATIYTAQSSKIVNAQLHNEKLYTIEQTKTSTQVYAHQQLLKVSTLMYEENNTNHIELEHITPDFITLKNITTQSIEFIGLQERTDIALGTTKITLRGNNSILSPDNSLLLYFTDYEINVLETATLTNKLIDRFSTKLLDAYWYNDNEHVIMVKNNEIILSDLRTNSSLQQTTPPINFTNITSTYLRDTSLLYISGMRNGISGLYTLVLE